MGTILATATGKIAFATSPFMVTLFLNLINRTELAQRSSKNSQKITLVDKGLTNHHHLLQEQVKQKEHDLKKKNDDESIKHEYRKELIEVKQKIDELAREEVDAKFISYQEFALYSKEVTEKLHILSLSLNHKIDSNSDSLITYEDLNRKISELFPDGKLNLDKILEAARLQSNAQLEPAREAYKDIRDNYRELQKSYSELNQAYQDNLSKTENYVTSEEMKQVQKDIFDNLSRSISEYNLYINYNRPQYELVYDRRGSRDEFIRTIKNNKKGWIYNQLKKFIELEQQYPNLKLKLLGTHEKFLICDRSFAMLGSHNFLTSNCHSSERELGLKTNDKNIIEDLINRFETAPNLDDSESLNYQQTTLVTSAR